MRLRQRDELGSAFTAPATQDVPLVAWCEFSWSLAYPNAPIIYIYIFRDTYIYTHIYIDTYIYIYTHILIQYNTIEYNLIWYDII